jgi:putative endonuclease
VPWFVYIARCADDTLYCGITNDLVARLAAHNAGKGARYTRTRTPIEIVATRRCMTKGRALSIEYQVKQLTRPEKQQLAAQWQRSSQRRRRAACDESRTRGARHE